MIQIFLHTIYVLNVKMHFLSYCYSSSLSVCGNSNQRKQNRIKFKQSTNSKFYKPNNHPEPPRVHFTGRKSPLKGQSSTQGHCDGNFDDMAGDLIREIRR